MVLLVHLVAIAFLLATPDIPEIFRWRAQPGAPPQIPPGQSLPLLPDLGQTGGAKSADKKAPRSDRLQPQSRLALVRYISGEFARAVRALPGGKKGFRIKAGAPLDEQALRLATASGGVAGSPGDTVQVTRIVFGEKEIEFDINGGGKKRTRLRDRIQISAGGLPTVSSSSGPPGYQAPGSTLILDFDRQLPDLTPDDVKQYLAGFLDFARQRSAAVNWVETLPPEIQQAIKEKRAMVGMDRDMVIAALGRPERKVRERDPDGLETEEWIYGHPPAKTVFVKFAGERAIEVKQYP